MFPFLQPFFNHRRDADYTEPTQLVKDAKKAADAAEEAAKEAEKQYNVANTAAKGKPFPILSPPHVSWFGLKRSPTCPTLS